MDQKTQHLISIDNVFNRFDIHFKMEDNTNIIFSGKFGIGKSYFLKVYFGEDLVKENYNAFFISPVNYSVASNEDIFELIKVDVIYNLFANGHLEMNKEEALRKDIALAYYIFNKPVSVVKHFSALLSKLHVSMEVLNGISESVEEMLKDFSDYEKKLNEGLSKESGKQLYEFVEEKQDIKGSYLEYDIITKLIASSLERMKKQNKQNVLVIDDVDRLDPGHIFRILNVLSSHNHETGNKFGFDKVILVCDLSNIENIFKHTYGANTDFEGYIDKFYSIERYFFNNSEAISFYLKTNFKNFLSEDEIKVLSLILICFEKENLITLRKIIKLIRINKIYSNSNTYELVMPENVKSAIQRDKVQHVSPDTAPLYFTTEDLKILNILRVLKTIFGDYNLLRINFTKILTIEYPIEDDMIISIVRILAIPERLRKKGNSPDLYFKEPPHLYNEPVVKIGPYTCMLKVKWTKQNRYSGKESYFTDVTYTDDIKRVPDKFTIPYVISTIMECFNYLKTQNMLINN
jgi:hypothetical protein